MDVQPAIEHRDAQPYVGIVRSVTMGSLVPALPDAGAQLEAWLEQRGLRPAGPPFWRYRVIDMAGRLEVEAGLPLAHSHADPASGVQRGELPAGRYATVTHVGHPDGLEDVTGQLIRWASREGVRWDMTQQPDGEHWASRLEIYRRADPTTDMATWETQLAFKLAD